MLVFGESGSGGEYDGDEEDACVLIRDGDGQIANETRMGRFNQVGGVGGHTMSNIQ